MDYYTQGVKQDSTCKVPQISDIMQGSQMLQEPNSARPPYTESSF